MKQSSNLEQLLENLTQNMRGQLEDVKTRIKTIELKNKCRENEKWN